MSIFEGPEYGIENTNCENVAFLDSVDLRAFTTNEKIVRKKKSLEEMI